MKIADQTNTLLRIKLTLFDTIHGVYEHHSEHFIVNCYLAPDRLISSVEKNITLSIKRLKCPKISLGQILTAFIIINIAAWNGKRPQCIPWLLKFQHGFKFYWNVLFIKRCLQSKTCQHWWHCIMIWYKPRYEKQYSMIFGNISN